MIRAPETELDIAANVNVVKAMKDIPNIGIGIQKLISLDLYPTLDHTSKEV